MHLGLLLLFLAHTLCICFRSYVWKHGHLHAEEEAVLKNFLLLQKCFWVTSAQRLRYLLSVPNRPMAIYWAVSVQFLCCSVRGWESLMDAVQTSCQPHHVLIGTRPASTFLRKFNIKQGKTRSKSWENSHCNLLLTFYCCTNHFILLFSTVQLLAVGRPRTTITHWDKTPSDIFLNSPFSIIIQNIFLSNSCFWFQIKSSQVSKTLQIAQKLTFFTQCYITFFSPVFLSGFINEWMLSTPAAALLLYSSECFSTRDWSWSQDHFLKVSSQN